MPEFDAGSSAFQPWEFPRSETLEKTHAGLADLKIRTERTRLEGESRESRLKAFQESITGARKRIVDARCLALLQKTNAGLPERSQGWLRGLEQEATPNGDSGTPELLRTRPTPIAILRYINLYQPQVEQEARKIPSPEAFNDAQTIIGVFTAFREAIGTLHRDAIVSDPFASMRNPEVDARGAH